eukprot:CAMPEP_0182448056 /NCGR_PEP_ID=MMETSP1172-20130603/23142_1 /TAXON_ID=708627 /ORGANISM="Timspurckia oligopyrenoides, Strain CCMP3278" /LENGTH=933 /DNA_ID=CAMNT_0024644773 /DNA_START=665 /DNA_END=3466 /DNA_ORIENTATION=-
MVSTSKVGTSSTSPSSTHPKAAKNSSAKRKQRSFKSDTSRVKQDLSHPLAKFFQLKSLFPTRQADSAPEPRQDRRKPDIPSDPENKAKVGSSEQEHKETTELTEEESRNESDVDTEADSLEEHETIFLEDVSILEDDNGILESVEASESGGESSDDDDGVSERLQERNSRNQQENQNVKEPKVEGQGRRILGFGPRWLPKKNPPVVDVRDQVPTRSFGGLNDSSVHEIIMKAMLRRRQQGYDNELSSLIPYDLQAELFDEILRTRSERANSDVGFLQRSKSVSSIVDSPNPELRSEESMNRVLQWTQKRFSDVQTLVLSPFQRNALDSEDENAEKKAAREKKLKKREAQKAAEKAQKAAEKQKSSRRFVFNGVELDEKMLAMASALSGIDDASTSAAFVTAAAAATISASKSSVIHAQRPSLFELGYPQLTKAIRIAEHIGTNAEARDYVNAIGVGFLVAAVRLLDGEQRASALQSLSNLATLMPTSRADMLLADTRSLSETLMSVIMLYDAPRSRFETESRMSALDLLGALSLTRGSVGEAWRREMVENTELIAYLRSITDASLTGSAEAIARCARKALASLGVNDWKPRVEGQRGLRVLCIDGGGTRAVMSFEMLKHLKRITGSEIHELFDVICGTSTGGIVAASIGLMHKSVEDVEKLYRGLIGRIFDKKPVSAPKLLFTRAFYDTAVFEKILKQECGSVALLDSQMDSNANKVFVVSSIMSRNPKELHLFRNYTYPVGYSSRYQGTPEAFVWEAMRASSAAPTYFAEVRVNGELHADGAIVANNPAACAISEVKCLYPGVPIECLVSLGNGELKKGSEEEVIQNVGWNDILSSIIGSATSTEHTHHVLDDTLPKNTYFRLNPKTKSVQIDETSSERLSEWVADAKEYIEANEARFEELSQVLRPKKRSRSIAFWAKQKENDVDPFFLPS